jgi:hypothetical protein
MDDPVFRPKGMHRKTFTRLERRYIRAQRQMNTLARAYFGAQLESLRSRERTRHK